VARLHSAQPSEWAGSLSEAPAAHGGDRRQFGYHTRILVEQSRFLENSIFKTLKDNLASIILLSLLGVMVIALRWIVNSINKWRAYAGSLAPSTLLNVESILNRRGRYLAFFTAFSRVLPGEDSTTIRSNAQRD
jgi:hypothetical protein